MVKQVEASIRPVIPRNRYENLPIVKTNIVSGTQSGNTLTYDVQPPAGVTWTLNYASMAVTAGGNTLATCSIQFYDGTQFVQIEALGAGSFDTIGDKLSIASFGNGPIILTNSKYLRFAYFDAGGGANATIHEVALVEPR